MHLIVSAVMLSSIGIGNCLGKPHLQMSDHPRYPPPPLQGPIIWQAIRRVSAKCRINLCVIVTSMAQKPVACKISSYQPKFLALGRHSSPGKSSDGHWFIFELHDLHRDRPPLPHVSSKNNGWAIRYVTKPWGRQSITEASQDPYELRYILKYEVNSSPTP